MKKKLIIVLIILINITLIYGNDDYTFDQLSIKDGLINSSVTGIVQDSKGFLWIATRNGLNRYDGKNIKTYQYDENNPNSLQENYLNKIFIDNRDILWITSQNGLTRFNIKEEKFTNYTNEPGNPNSIFKGATNVIYKDRKGVVWIGNSYSGIQILDENSGIFKRDFYRNSGKDGSLKNIMTSVIEDKDGYIFLEVMVG